MFFLMGCASRKSFVIASTSFNDGENYFQISPKYVPNGKRVVIGVYLVGVDQEKYLSKINERTEEFDGMGKPYEFELSIHWANGQDTIINIEHPTGFSRSFGIDVGAFLVRRENVSDAQAVLIVKSRNEEWEKSIGGVKFELSYYGGK